MVKKLITVELASGLEARPAAMLCLTAGESILVEADGKDEEAAVTEIEKYLKNQ